MIFFLHFYFLSSFHLLFFPLFLLPFSPLYVSVPVFLWPLLVHWGRVWSGLGTEWAWWSPSFTCFGWRQCISSCCDTDHDGSICICQFMMEGCYIPYWSFLTFCFSFGVGIGVSSLWLGLWGLDFGEAAFHSSRLCQLPLFSSLDLAYLLSLFSVFCLPQLSSEE